MTAVNCRKLIITAITIFIILSVNSLFAESKSTENRKLVVGTKHIPPFAIKKIDGTWEGISIELWKQIAEELNLNYEFHELSLDDLLQGLKDGSLDAAVAALTVTAKREQTIDFTHPFHTSGLGIAVSLKHKRGWLNVIDRFLSWPFFKVVLTLVGVLFVAGTLVWFFERKRNPEQFNGNLSKGLGSAFWWSAVTMTTVGYGDKAPKTIGGRLVALVWMFTSIIIIASFTAAIASSLTVSRLKSIVAGPEDLPKVRVGTVKASTSENYLQNQHIPYTAYETPIDGLKAIVAGQLDAVVYDAPILRYLANKEFPGTVEVLPHMFERQYYAIGLKQDSTLREPINQVLIEKISQAKWQQVLYRYLGE